MASNVPQNPNSHNIASILPKLQDPDPDIRYMTLNDLHRMLENGNPSFLLHDYTTCCKVVDGLLHTLADTHGDVQNMAIQCLGPFVQKAPESILCPTIEKVSTIQSSGGGVDNSIPALGVRAIVVALPHPVPGVPWSQKVIESYSAVSKALIPRLVGRVVVPIGNKAMPAPPRGMLQVDMDTGSDSNSLDLFAEVARGFGPMLQEVEIQALEDITMQILQNDRCSSVMKKKAVIALSSLAPFFSDALLSQHVTNSIEKLRSPHLTSQQRKLYLSVFGSLARTIPSKFGPYLKTLTPFVLSPLSEEELQQQREAEAEADGERDVALEEAREAALVALEAFLHACPQDVKAYTKDITDAALRFLKYDPNVVEDDEDEDMEEDQDADFEMDEDFEEETGFDDEDDVSWKVRRCSAKVLHALIQMLDPNDPAVYNQIAPVLIARFKEREESVRIEVITTLAYLVTRTGSVVATNRTSEHLLHMHGKKRRRGFSDSLGTDLQTQQAIMNGYASPSTPPPVDDATHGLARINPEIVSNSARLLKTSTIPTKQVILVLLKDMVLAQHGGLTGTAEQAVDPVLEILQAHQPVGSNIASNNLRIEALALLRAIAETHSNKVIRPYLNNLIPALVAATKDRYAKVAAEALSTIERYIRSLTPPRAAASNSENRSYLSQLFGVIIERVSASDTDTEVRQKAIQALGLLIGRTSGSAGETLLSQQDRFTGQQLIVDRMKNELTRLPCVRAVDTIAVLAQSSRDFKPDFVGTATLELGAQLRKSARSLRGASLSALRMLAVNQASRECMDEQVVAQLVKMLIPLLQTEDLHMLGPALVVLAAIAKDKPALVATPAVIEGICGILTSALSGVALEGLLTCVETLGRAGAGKDLMAALLKLGTRGDTDVTGQVIGTLLVSGDQNIGIDLSAFSRELETQKDEPNRCLALSVLGEAGLRMGAECPLTPQSFMNCFEDDFEKVQLAAAVALGRAGSGNVKAYLPKIIDALMDGDKQYLLLNSVKELLQHSNAEDEIKPYTQKLWQNVITSGQSEDNRVVGTECLGRIAIVDPSTYLKQLQSLLRDENPRVRGMSMSALRYVFADTDESYNIYLQGAIVSMLEIMLADTDLENSRLALSAFNSAFHNKPDLVLPFLSQLLPFAMEATVPRPQLVREVTMGPFKHKVDDGLEIRKSAYETLYALLESPDSQSRLDLNGAFYDRIVAGISDEQEIKILCCLVLTKLLPLAISETQRRLDSLAGQFRTVLAFKPKETAVKQELEKLTEQNKAVIKAAAAVNKLLSSNTEESRVWREFYDWARREFGAMVKQAEDELKEGRDR